MTVRIAHLVIQPVLVRDDGEELLPGPVLEAQPVVISRLPEFIAQLRAFCAEENVSEQAPEPAQQTEPEPVPAV
jgi:hypothetical protein